MRRRITDFGDTSQPSSLERVKVWIKNCTENHRACGSGEMRPLPTRVLDLFGKNQTILLHESMNGMGKYACLSHCWGGSQPITTTSKNLERHKERIEWPALPRSFQDAVIFARKLHVRYLWIDSLCIIQDNDADWQRESGKMASIYQNAYITFAVSRSSGADGGCFSKMRPEFRAHEVYQMPWSGQGQQIKIYARRKLPHYLRGCYQPDEAKYRTSEFPLLNRAWTYQELLLSPRVLYFGENELIWECSEFASCECRGLPRYVRPRDLYTFMQADEEVPLERFSRLAQRWHRIVEEYSCLQLSFEKDKLPALSGLANYMQNFRTDRYLAGIWENELPMSLFWMIDDPNGSLCRRPAKYTAPSWSWASIVGPIKSPLGLFASYERIWCSPAYNFGFTDNRLRISAKILAANCVVSGLDTTGEVSSGYLVLSAPAYSAEFLSDSSCQAGIYTCRDGLRRDIYLDIPLWGASENHEISKVMHGVLFLFILKFDNRDFYLILKVHNRQSMLFERIGIAQFENPSQSEIGRLEDRVFQRWDGGPGTLTLYKPKVNTQGDIIIVTIV